MHHRVCLNLSFRSDIEWWNSFITDWNGVSLMKPNAGAESSVHVWTDASGCGAFVPTSHEWLQLQWPDSYPAGEVQLKEESIALKELLPIVLACGVWGSNWTNQTVIVHCDNLGVVSLVNTGYSRIRTIMHLLRSLFFIRERFQLEVWATHVPGMRNVLADAISRNNLQLFFLQVPEAMHRRKDIPQDLLSLLVGQQPIGCHQSGHDCSQTLFRRCCPSHKEKLPVRVPTLPVILRRSSPPPSLPSHRKRPNDIRGIPSQGEAFRRYRKELFSSGAVFTDLARVG